MPPTHNTPEIIGIQARLKNLGLHLGLHGDVTYLMRLLYTFDGFLARLANSAYHDRLVLGGGLFLWKVTLGLQSSRPTQDADFTCLWPVPADANGLRAVLQQIVAVPAADPLMFAVHDIALHPILQGRPDLGQRARLPVYLGKAQQVLSLDLTFGTALLGAPQLRQIPTTLDPSVTIPVLTYPLESVMAGKVAAALKHGAQNTRYKDYFDLYLLAQSQDFNGTGLYCALALISQAEGFALDATNEVFASPGFLTDPVQLAGWAAFVRITNKVRAVVMPDFATALTLVRALYVPVLTGAAQGQIWDHTTQRWR